MTLNKLDEVQKVIQAISIGTQTATPPFIAFLSSLIHDKSLDLTQQLHNKLAEEGIHASSLTFNYLL
jgi:hypothetical protein